MKANEVCQVKEGEEEKGKENKRQESCGDDKERRVRTNNGRGSRK